MQKNAEQIYKIKLLKSKELEPMLNIKQLKYVSSLDVGSVYLTKYLKRMKYCLRCLNPPLTRQKIFFRDLKFYNQKILVEFPYIPEDLSCQERLSFHNSRNLLLQITKNQEWKDLNSKRNFQSIVFAAVEANLKNPKNTNQNVVSNIISQKLYRFEKKLAVAKRLKSFSYVGYFDINFVKIMNSLNKIQNFGNLKIQLCGENLNFDNLSLQCNAYQYLTELEVKTTGKVFALSHIEENHKNLINLETLCIRVNNLVDPDSLTPLNKFVNFSKLKYYNLHLNPMDHKTISGWLKNLTIPKNTERLKFYFTDTTPWNEAIDCLYQDKQMKKHFLEAWSGLSKLKEIYILTEASRIYRRQHVRLSLLMLNAFPSIETLTIILTATDEKYNQMQGDIIDYIDMNVALQHFLPRLPSLKQFSFITTALSIETFGCEPSAKMINLEGLTLTNVRGAKSIYNLFNCIEKKKNFKLVLTNMVVSKEEDLQDVFFALKEMAGLIIGSLDFLIINIDEAILKDHILRLRSTIKRPYILALKFKIPSMKREYLEEIGQKCNNMFTKLEIETGKYYLNIQEHNLFYHLVNVSLQSETTTSTDSDF